MDLCLRIKDNIKAIHIVEKFQKISRSASDDIASALNALSESTNSIENVNERIELAYNMVVYMEPVLEDVIALLLHVSYANGKASVRNFKEWFREDRYQYYYNWMLDATRNAKKNDDLSRIQQIDYYIMMRVCDRMFDAIIRTMNKKGIPDTIDVFEAYDFAKKAHYWVCRKSGEPYLTHPISVAKILADVGVESSIIAAALLHDVVEDTEYTLKDIADKCGVLISKYVDAVTSVHRQYQASYNRSEYTYDKAELDAKSFDKLVQAVAVEPRMVFALYIKAADRIHNLRTIDKMSSEKKHAKTDETELDYLPLFRKFNLNYFVNVIEDLTWRTNNSEYYESVKAKYEDMLERNKDFINEMKYILSIRLGNEFNRMCSMLGFNDAGYDIAVSERFYLTREVYGFVKETIGVDQVVTVESINKKTVPLCDFDIIVESADKMSSMDTFITMFVKMFMEHIAPTGRTIIDIDVDKHKRFIVKVEDRHRTVFRLCFSTRDDYIAYKIGSVKGAGVPEDNDDVVDENSETIYVRLRNGKTIPMPNGATVLDVAFFIHPQIGLSAKAATINGHAASLYNCVHDGDQIVVSADGPGKDVTCRVKINWLNHVVTEKARKAIIKKLIKKYGEEDPKNDYPASDITANNVVDVITEVFEGNDFFESLD